jgi:AcrR family transcriptional regulator
MAKTASADTRRRRERGSISVDEILNGAFEVAAEVSIDNLSMPLLAKRLDVGVTSIYWYFRRKDDLLDAMTDRALERYEITGPSIDASNWRESLRRHARMTRREFRGNSIPVRPHPDSSTIRRTRCTAHCRRSNNRSPRWSRPA